MSTEMVQLGVRSENRPVLDRLLRKLDPSLPDTPTHLEWNSVIRRFGGGDDLMVTGAARTVRNVRYASAHEACIDAWHQVIRDTDLTLDQLYYGLVELPASIADADDEYYGFDPAALLMLGVPMEDISDWRRTTLRRAPHYVHTAVVKERPKGQVPITANQYIDLFQDPGSAEIKDWSGGSNGMPVRRIKPYYIRKWYELVAGLREMNVNPDSIIHLAGWVTSEWSAQAMVRFQEAGISPVGADSMEALGVTRSDLIVAVRNGEMPLEWAIAASELEQ